MCNWNYGPSIDKARIEHLRSETSFMSIAERIKQEMSVLCFHLQPCDDDSTYARPVFCVRVQSQTFDAFFNSSVGYRGAFYSSPFSGLQANHLLMEQLVPGLIEWASMNRQGHDISLSKNSFAVLSAKAWLAEIGLELCEKCKGEWAHPQDSDADIENGRWERSESANAKKGRKAPLHTKIRLFGGFVNTSGDEFVPARKCRRAFDLSESGWA